MGSRPPSPSRSKSRSRSRSPARTSTTATTAPGTSSSPSKQHLKKPNDADHDAVIRYSRDELLACQPAGFLDKSAMLHDTFQTRSKAELLAASNASGDRGGGGRGDPLARKGRANSNATRPDSLDVTRGAGGAGGDRRKYTNRSPSPGGTRHHRTDRGDRGGGGAHQRDRVNSTGNNNAGGAEQSVLEKLASLRQFVPTDRDRDRGERSGTYERRDRNAAAAANDERGASDQRRRDFGREFAALGERRRNPDQYPNPTLDRYFDWEADQDKKNDETFGDDAGTEDFDFLANDFDPIASYKAEMRARDGRRHIESAPEEVKADPIAAFRQMMKQASHDDVEGDALEPEGQETSDTADFAAAPAEARPMGRFGRFFAAMEESPVATPAKEEPTPVVQEQSTPITSPQGGESDNKGSFAFIMQRLSGANVGGGDASGVKQAEPMAEPAVPRAQPVESVPDRLPSASPKAQLQQQQQQQQQSRQLPSPTGSFPAPSREGSVPPPSTAGGQPISPSNNMPLSGPHMPQGPIPGLPPGMHPDHYAQHQAIMRQQFLMQQAAAAAQRAGQPQQHHQHPQQQQQQQQQQPARPSGNMDPRDQHILDVQRRQQQLMLHHHHQQLGGVPPGVAPYPGYPNQPPPPPTEQDLLEAAARERAMKKKAQQLVAQGAPTSVTRRMVAAQNLPRPPPPHMAGQPGGAGGPYPPGSGGAGYHPQNAAAAAAAREAAHAAIMEQLGRTRPPHQGNAPHGGPSPPHPSHMQGPPPPHMIYGPPPPHMMGPPPPGSAGMRPRAPLPPNAADAQSALYNFLQQQHHHQQQAGGAPPNTSGAPGGSPTSGTPPPRPMHPGMPGMQQRPPGMPPGMPPPPPFMMGGPPPPGMPPHIMYGPPPPGMPPHMMYGPPQGVPQGPPGMLPPHLQAAAGGAGQRRE